MSQSNNKPAMLKLQEITRVINELQHDLALNAELDAASILENQIHSSTDFGAHLNTRRKELGIELATLELQTGVSTSTLKRLFRNPEQVKFVVA
jgi:hypothetical protein